MRALGVLLAGGRGARLGGDAPKALVVCGGRTLLERARVALREVCDEVVVVAPATMSLPVPDRERVADPPGAAGPLAAMVSGLGARAHDEAVVLAVDLPLVGAATLASLRGRIAGARAVVPRPGGVAQPLAAWYAGDALATLATALAAGERSVTAAVSRLEVEWVEDDLLARLPGGLDAWLNVNTREDLAAAEARLAAERR
jgi:molybdopterin-guanine dinucleotide biosynthesis protein A